MSEYIIAHCVDSVSGVRYDERREEIVRCRDCKWCMAYMSGTYCDYMSHAVELGGFCSWGDRREP